MDLIQQLVPALAALHQQGPRIAHGLLTAERIIITREGRLIVVEHVLASAFELLRLPASRLRAEFGIAVPSGTDPVGLNQRSDVVQLGFVALSLLLGRRLDPAHYPANVTTLLDEFAQADPASAPRLRPWLERALQQGDRPFASAQEAQTAFGGPHAEIGQPASTSQGDASHAVLAFRGPADKGEFTPTRLKADIPRLDVRPGAAEPKADPKHEPRTDAVDHKRSVETHAPTPVSSVALPRPARSKTSATKWIVAAVVTAVVGVGGFVIMSLVRGNTTVTPPVTASRPPQPAPATAPPVAVPLPPSSVPPASAPPFGSTAGSTPDGKPATPASGVAAPAPGATGADATGATTSRPAGAAGGLAGLGATSDGTPVDRPVRAAGAFGGVRVNSPIELQVFENGTLVGSTAGPIAVMEGSHALELVNESLGFRVRSTVNVRGGLMTPLAIAVPNGRLSINAVPWADVFIDGKPAGQTPLANVAVPIGQHVVVFKHPDLGEQTQTVIVKADGLTRVSATFK
jgi:hypothetical protein